MKAPLIQTAGPMIRRQVDAPATPTAHAIQRARLVDAACRPSRPRRAVAWLLVPAVVLLALLIVPRLLKFEAKPVSFQVGANSTSGVTGQYYTAEGGQQFALSFSEGSRITLDPHARARVAHTTSHGASIVLETGGARVDVVHRADTDWNVLAGPYTIAVKGTSFEVVWSASSTTLEVAMFSGRVVVRGPGVESGVEVKDTQRFVISTSLSMGSAPPDAAVQVSPSPSASGVPSGEAPRAIPTPVVEDPALPAASTPAAPGSAIASSASVPAARAESWSALASRGEYRAILLEADQRGIDATLASASAPELTALASAGRFGGRGDVAERALLALRSRFPGGSQAASAAFLLGRMSEDGGNLGNAIRWYDTYLGEAPGGPLAPEALGRRMVALRRAGNSSAALQAAESYLAQFPTGPYAGVAREIAGP